jgi:hypothetical protein
MQMKFYYFLATAILISACSSEKTKRVVRGPEGVFAEISESKAGASAANSIVVTLESTRTMEKAVIFRATGGSDANVVFLSKHLVVIQYCQPNEYTMKSYLYSLGDDYSFSDVRIVAATTDSQIGMQHFCESGIVKVQDKK